VHGWKIECDSDVSRNRKFATKILDSLGIESGKVEFQNWNNVRENPNDPGHMVYNTKLGKVTTNDKVKNSMTALNIFSAITAFLQCAFGCCGIMLIGGTASCMRSIIYGIYTVLVVTFFACTIYNSNIIAKYMSSDQDRIQSILPLEKCAPKSLSMTDDSLSMELAEIAKKTTTVNTIATVSIVLVVVEFFGQMFVAI
jgi:hypothetical protein